ncbi:MAG: ATP-dependent helicase [Acidobacteriia bacterium]|nr:ATP-dependent helicase [Terriglobia bacterium]
MPITYTPEQLNAIGHRGGNLLIIACAGSGKTEVISRRIAQLVQEGADRRSIVAFTFTEKAAAALKARIRKHLEELLPADPSLGDMYVGTIHSFCLQVLKELDPSYRNFEVIDEVRQAALICTHFNDANGRGLGLDHLRHLVRTNGFFDTIRAFTRSLTAIHLESIDIRHLGDAHLREAVERYNNLTRQRPNYYLDFDGIIDEAVRKLRTDPEALRTANNRFKHVVVDEYQDIDPRQEELITLLSRRADSLCVVGDDDQSIYGWRGADITNILNFHRRHAPVRRIQLVDNFRSTHAVVEVANAAVRRLGTRLDKAMVARHWERQGQDDILVETMAEHGDVHRQTFATEAEEAGYVADRILAHRGSALGSGEHARGLDWGDMAILLRSVRTSAHTFVEELSRRRIPHVVKGTAGLFDHREVQLVQAVFCFLAGMDFSRRSDGNFVQLDERQTREFIRTTLEAMRDEGDAPNSDSARFLEWLAARRRLLQQAALPRDRRPARVARRIYPQTIFHEMLEALGTNRGPTAWPDQILFNLGRFSNLLTQYEAVHQWVTPGLLFGLNIFLNGWASGTADEGGQDDPTVVNAIQILTIHAAKGLEWPVVFIPSVCSRRFPSSMRTRGTEVLLNPAEYNAQRYIGGDDGERRLWYVALTRCQKFLHVTSVDRRNCRPTEFHREIRHDYVRDDGVDPSAPRPVLPPRRPIETEYLPTSYSDLNYFWECPFDYRLRKLMGFGPTIGQEFGYGEQIHNLLAAIHERARTGPVTREWVEQLVDTRFNLRYTRDEPLDRMRDAAKRTLVGYVTQFPDVANLVFEAEKPFEFMLEDALVTGTIDLLERVEGAAGERVPVGVVDFKTGLPDDPDDLQARIETVDRQLRLYAIAVRRALNLDPRRAVAHFMSPDRQHVRQEIDITEPRLEDIRQQVRDAVIQIKAGNFPRRPCARDRCPTCDFQRICPGRERGPHA